MIQKQSFLQDHFFEAASGPAKVFVWSTRCRLKVLWSITVGESLADGVSPRAVLYKQGLS